jgi:hypothetical protein
LHQPQLKCSSGKNIAKDKKLSQSLGDSWGSIKLYQWSVRRGELQKIKALSSSEQWAESSIDRESTQSSYAKVNLLRSHYGMEIRGLASRIGNSSSSFLKSATMVVTAAGACYNVVMMTDVSILTIPLSHETIKSSINARELTQRVTL